MGNAAHNARLHADRAGGRGRILDNLHIVSALLGSRQDRARGGVHQPQIHIVILRTVLDDRICVFVAESQRRPQLLSGGKRHRKLRDIIRLHCAVIPRVFIRIAGHRAGGVHHPRPAEVAQIRVAFRSVVDGRHRRREGGIHNFRLHCLRVADFRRMFLHHLRDDPGDDRRRKAGAGRLYALRIIEKGICPRACPHGPYPCAGRADIRLAGQRIRLFPRR